MACVVLDNRHPLRGEIARESLKIILAPLLTGRIDPTGESPASILFLYRTVRESHFGERQGTLERLTRLGSDAKAAVPILKEAAKIDPVLRPLIEKAITRIERR